MEHVLEQENGHLEQNLEEVEQNEMLEYGLRLWLEGSTYREVVNSTGLSTGDFSRFLAKAREATPDLNDLRALNIRLKNTGAKIPDLIRASNLDVNLTETEEKLRDLTSKVAAEKKTLEYLSLERETLDQEVSKIKEIFTAKGLSFEEGLTIVKDVRDLLLEKESLEREVSKLEDSAALLDFDIGELEKKLGNQTQIKYSINLLRSKQRALQRSCSRLQQEKTNLKNQKLVLESKISQHNEEVKIVKRENELLLERKKEIETSIAELETLKEATTQKIKDMIKKANAEKLEIEKAGRETLARAKEQGNLIISSAETKKDRDLASIRSEEEELREKVDVLKAEEQLLKSARAAGFKEESVPAVPEQKNKERLSPPRSRWESFLQEN